MAESTDKPKAPETKPVDSEAMRIALAERVADAKKALAAAEQAAIVSAKPVITEFSGFSNKQKGAQVGMFNIRGENLGGLNPLGITLNGHTAKITGVRADCIKGIVPQDVGVGAVRVVAGEATFQGTLL